MIGYLTAVIFAMGLSLHQAMYVIKTVKPQPSDTPRTDLQMCQEVERELLIQVGEGMLELLEADRIIRRCYTIFVDSK